MQLVVTFAQIVGYCVVLAMALFCLAELTATMRTIARSENREERAAVSSGFLWYGAGPLVFIGLYWMACVVAGVASRTGWWVLPSGFVACAIPFGVAGLKGRWKYANRRMNVRRH